MKMWSNTSSHSLLIRVQNGADFLEKFISFLTKLTHFYRTTQTSCSLIFTLRSWTLRSTKSLPMDVYSSFIHIAKTWSQPRCLFEGEWINKLWHIQTMGYYSVLKKKKKTKKHKTTDELLNPEKTWRNLKCLSLSKKRASLVAQLVKNLPTMWETWVRFLGWEDPLEREMATHSSTIAWKIPWKEEPSRLQSMGLQRVGHNWATKLSLSLLGWHSL